jgi:hypothetical protein
MSLTKKTASTLSPEIRSLPKAKQEANEAFYAEPRTFMPDKDLHQPLFLVVNGVVSKLVALSYAHTSTSSRPEWILKGLSKPEWILKGFSELGQLLTTPIRDDYRLIQHLPVALQLDNPKWAAYPFRQAVAKLLSLACKSEDKKETATARRKARQQLTADIGNYLQEGVAEEIGTDLLAVARTFPSGKEQVEEDPAAQTPEPHSPTGKDQSVPELIPGGFSYRGKPHDLTGEPVAMLKEILASRWHRCSRLELRAALGKNDESVEYPDQAIIDTAKKLRAALKKAVAEAGLTCANPLPSGGRGMDLSYSLKMP